MVTDPEEEGEEEEEADGEALSPPKALASGRLIVLRGSPPLGQRGGQSSADGEWGEVGSIKALEHSLRSIP